MRNSIPELISLYKQFKKVAQSSLYQRMRNYIDPIFSNISEADRNKLLELHELAPQIQRQMLQMSPQNQVRFARQLAAHYGLNPNLGTPYILGIYYDSIGNAAAARNAFTNAGKAVAPRRMTPSPIDNKPETPGNALAAAENQQMQQAPTVRIHPTPQGVQPEPMDRFFRDRSLISSVSGNTASAPQQSKHPAPVNRFNTETLQHFRQFINDFLSNFSTPSSQNIARPTPVKPTPLGPNTPF